MLRMIEGAGVLLLFSMFFAHVLAPVVALVRRRVRVGPRRRPISDARATLLLYVALFAPGILVFRLAEPAARHWVTVTAPARVDQLFSGGAVAPLDEVVRRLPLPQGANAALMTVSVWVAESLERHTRATLDEAIAATHHARWLLVTPVIAFALLTAAPAFQRSALRVLPRGHLRWRLEEYLRDVNSALAGYVRAQAAAGLVVAAACAIGFALMRVPYAVSLGVLAGILELLPAIGPVTVLLIATSQGGQVLAILIFLVALRIVQDYVVYPRLVRHGMHLSTIAVIVTVWIGATIAGAAGVLLAIPVAGCLSVSVRHIREYREIEQLVARRID
jgi:predicted PurR-regulated permease PerM